jgi:hypothetical protein
MTEQAAARYDFEPEEDWLEEQLLDIPDIEIPARESPIEIHDSPGISRLSCYFISAFSLLYLRFFL